MGVIKVILSWKFVGFYYFLKTHILSIDFIFIFIFMEFKSCRMCDSLDMINILGWSNEEADLVNLINFYFICWLTDLTLERVNF